MCEESDKQNAERKMALQNRGRMENGDGNLGGKWKRKLEKGSGKWRMEMDNANRERTEWNHGQGKQKTETGNQNEEMKKAIHRHGLHGDGRARLVLGDAVP